LISLSDSQIQCQISEGIREVSASELQILLSQEKLQLMDVREPHEWNSGCIPGARGFPLFEMTTGLDAELRLRDALSLDPSCMTVFYCQSGTRSRIAVETLLRSDARFAGKLAHLKGGLAMWPNPLSRPGMDFHEKRLFMLHAPKGHREC
jgi:rhodanese-related sulfurtransferase